MDPNFRIYQDDVDKIPQEDKARLEGYMHGRAEQESRGAIEALRLEVEKRIREELMDTEVGAQKFRKKPVVIEAIQYTGDNIQDIWNAFTAEHIYGPVEDEPRAFINTPEGQMAANPGDWIIRGVAGELYPCKPDIFEKTYEAVEE